MHYYRLTVIISATMAVLTTQQSIALFSKEGMLKPTWPKSKAEWGVVVPVATYFAYYSIIKFKRPLTIDKLPPLQTGLDYVLHAQIERDEIDPITNQPKYPAHGFGHVLTPLDKAGKVFISYIKMLYFIRELYNDTCLFLELFAP